MNGRTTWPALVLALLLAAGACASRQDPLAPADRTESAPSGVPPRIDPGAAAPLADALTRIVPMLSGPNAAALGNAVARLARAVTDADDLAASHALVDARSALAAYAAATGSAAEPDLDVIKLAVAAVGGDQ